MHYALTPRTFFFSHYFYTGLRIATGVIGLTLLVFWYANLPVAMAFCIGALCTSLMDLPSPLHHKFYEMLSSVLLCTAFALIVSLCTPIHWLLQTMIVLGTFLASMMVVYGRKALPLQFAALFIMTLSMENAVTPLQALVKSAVFFAGGMSYLAYAMAVAWLMRHRTRQQVLAEALYELARYVDIKADFYDVQKDLNQQFELLVRQQILLAEKQQASRDMILRSQRNHEDLTLVQVHYAMIDLYELVLSTHTEYAMLRKYFADTNILPLLGKLVDKAAQDIESVAYAVTSNRPSLSEINYQNEIDAIEREFGVLKCETPDPAYDEALAILRAAFNKIRAMTDMIGELHRAAMVEGSAVSLISGADLTPFLTQQKYGLRILLSNLRWTSSTFRFALRVSLAILTGLLVAQVLPYKSHSYWIALTIAVILKPTFGTTKKRRADRLIGTLIGCILSAIILHFVRAPAVLLLFLFLATVSVPAFVNLKYRYTAIAASMQILLLISLTVPHGGHAISERLLDTLIGAMIATFFSYVLPSWEFRALPQLVKNVLKANGKYIDAAKDLLQGRVADDFLYRLARKRFMDSLASLSSALTRMLEEPTDKQYAVVDLNRFIVQNYLVVAHIAALRVLFQRHKEGVPREAANLVLEELSHKLHNALMRAEQTLTGSTLLVQHDMHDINAADEGDAAIKAAPDSANWSGWPLLQRRAKLLYMDAGQLAQYSAAIGQTLRQAAS